MRDITREEIKPDVYAYDEMYLDDAMKNLGEAADYAASCCN